jgi:hypothetical protein
MTPATPERTDIRPLLPLYLVIVIAFLGYGMMVTLFVPMLIHHTSGFSLAVPPSHNARRRLGSYWRRTLSVSSSAPLLVPFRSPKLADI